MVGVLLVGGGGLLTPVTRDCKRLSFEKIEDEQFLRINNAVFLQPQKQFVNYYVKKFVKEAQ